MRPYHLLLLTLLAARIASACQCGYRPGPLEALPRSDAVFDGTVIRRTPFPANVDGSFFVLERTEFLVHQAWRGKDRSRIAIVTGFSNCDFLFDVGARYIVFARPAQRPDLGLGSSICLPTDTFRRSAQTLSVLGQGLSFHPPEFIAAESALTRTRRVAHSSFLWGALSSAGVLDSRFPFSSRLSVRVLIAPLAAVVSLGLVLVLALRRRYRLLLAVIPLSLLATLLSIALQGYFLIRSEPMLSYWILERHHGV